MAEQSFANEAAYVTFESQRLQQQTCDYPGVKCGGPTYLMVWTLMLRRRKLFENYASRNTASLACQGERQDKMNEK